MRKSVRIPVAAVDAKRMYICFLPVILPENAASRFFSLCSCIMTAFHNVFLLFISLNFDVWVGRLPASSSNIEIIFFYVYFFNFCVRHAMSNNFLLFVQQQIYQFSVHRTQFHSQLFSMDSVISSSLMSAAFRICCR